MKLKTIETYIQNQCPWTDQNAVRNITGYLDELTKWNSRINLTGIPEALWMDKIVFESLLLARIAIEETSNEDDDIWMDMGSGAGIPGLVIACLLPARKIYLVDSKQKKTDFMECVRSRLSLTNAAVLNCRLENIVSCYPLLKNNVNVFFSRALANVEKLAGYANMMAAENAVLIAPRGESEAKMDYNTRMIDSREWSGTVCSAPVPGSERNMHYAVLTVKAMKNA
jgi:16S rRNA (guanine527-N7)-methyltransferase